MFPPKRFDIFPLTGGCSEGLDAFRYFFKQYLSQIGQLVNNAVQSIPFVDANLDDDV